LPATRAQCCRSSGAAGSSACRSAARHNRQNQSTVWKHGDQHRQHFAPHALPSRPLRVKNEIRLESDRSLAPSSFVNTFSARTR
jgi:hypothetical protein